MYRFIKPAANIAGLLRKLMQPFVQRNERLLGFRFFFRQRRYLRLDFREPLLQIAALFFQSRYGAAHVGHLLNALNLFALHRLDHTDAVFHGGGERFELFAGVAGDLLISLKLAFNLLDTANICLFIKRQIRYLFLSLGNFAPYTLAVFIDVGDTLFAEPDLTLHAFELSHADADLLRKLSALFFSAACFFLLTRKHRSQIVKQLFLFSALFFQLYLCGFQPHNLFRLFIVIAQKQVDIQRFEPFAKLQEYRRVVRLFLKRLDHKRLLAQNIFHAHEVLARSVQLAFRLFFAHTVFHDTGGFLEYAAAIGRLFAQYFVDTTLSNDRVTFLADTCIAKQLQNIFQAAFCVVDGILALAAPVKLARNLNVGIIGAQPRIRVVEHERHLAV